MWRSADGAIHLVALPEPEHVFSGIALESLVQLMATMSYDDVDDRLQELQESEADALAEAAFLAAEEEPYVATPPPMDLFGASVGSWADLASSVQDVPSRWRLDLLVALEALNDSRDDVEAQQATSDT